MSELQLVAFYLDKEEYALEVHNIEEIIRLLPVTRVPRAPKCINGVVNLRGNVIPIMDLRKKFGIEPIAETENSRIIVVKVEGKLLGLLVDDVLEVARLDTSDIEPPPVINDKVKTEYLEGVVRIEERLLILFDLNKVADLKN